MEAKREQQDKDTDEIKRQLDKNKTLNDPGENVVDYGRSEQQEVEKSKSQRHLDVDSERNGNESIY